MCIRDRDMMERDWEEHTKTEARDGVAESPTLPPAMPTMSPVLAGMSPPEEAPPALTPPVSPPQEYGSSSTGRSLQSEAEGAQLDSEIRSYCAHMSTAQRSQQGEVLVVADQLSAVVSRLWPGAQLHLSGSRSCGLALPDSDIDFVVCEGSLPDDAEASASTRELASALELETWVLRVFALDRASVPVVKLQSGLSDCSIDITFLPASNGLRTHPHSGLAIGQLLCNLGGHYPAMTPIICIVKQLLRECNLNEAYTGGLSSTCLSCMVVAHLVHSPPTEDLGTALMSFLARHAQLDYSTAGISLQNGYFGKPHDGAALFVEDPIRPNTGNNIAAGCFSMDGVKAAFKHAHSALRGEHCGGTRCACATGQGAVSTTMLSRVLMRREWEMDCIFKQVSTKSSGDVCQLWQPIL
eukprot:TRINITY_DN13030_c0_g1_i2.p1 TRINITY_DN13030_c0_g1~~TRINITY_DN13030_c0_g1_i2.p1  ORF type:complete len:411 (-),score=93.75 TRINITY_DN13030_c0_g1_i2:45-1277(-)